MTGAVAHLVEEALLLSNESRLELVEALLECSVPSKEFVTQHMQTVVERMDAVREGRSELVSEEEAHRRVRQALASVS